MWAKLQKLSHTHIIFSLLLQNLTRKMIQHIDILINFAPKSILFIKLRNVY